MLGKLKKSDASGSEDKNWYKDKYQYILVQRNILAVVTLAGLFVALLAVFAVMQLTPSKSVEPFVIEIDEKTGIVQQVEPVSKKEFTANEAIDDYFVVKYVRSREAYSAADFRYNYNTVRLMSDPIVFRNYRQEVAPSNPDSPAAILQGTGQRSIKFKSISYIRQSDEKGRSSDTPKTKVAQVRVVLEDSSVKSPVPIKYHRLITVQYQYSDLDLNEEELYINPLGFTVLSYRSDRDAAL